MYCVTIEPFGHGGDLLACVLCVEPFGHGGDLLACVLRIESFGHGADLFDQYNVCVLCIRSHLHMDVIF